MKPSHALPRRTGGLASPKRGRESGFTLMEIAIVAIIVGLLSTLAVATVRHLQQRAARSTILNNLRQLHEAKEHYFFESGTDLATPKGLAQSGYLRQSAGDRVTSGATFEAHLGWHYGYILMPGQPTYAYQGADPGTPAGRDKPGVMNWSKPTGEVIWYPGPPPELAAAATGSGSPATVAAQPVAKPAQPPSLAPVAGPPGAPVLASTGSANGRRLTLVTQTEIYYTHNEWTSQAGITSPDGSPMKVVSVRSDPPDFLKNFGPISDGFKADIAQPGIYGQATVYVTVKNSAGESTLPFTLTTGRAPRP
jgi:prepilin-type N-terminal cleavage/methylation domain-containing protein